MYSLWFVQWDFTRRDHPGNLGRVSGSGLISAAVLTTGGADNAVYFTGEHFVVGLLFPVLSLVKQSLYFTRVPPTLVHSNVFQILTVCSVLNFYQLDISLVEICFIYTLKLGVGGCLVSVCP